MKIEIKVPTNKYQLLSIVLAVALLIVGGMYLRSTGMFTYADPNVVGQKAIDFINTNVVRPGTSASLVRVEKFSGMYKVITSYNGHEIPVYITIDGKYMFLCLPVDITQTLEEAQKPEIPKRDRPVVELYVFSYCPAGSAAIKPFIEVAKLLKNYAEFRIRFFSHMHGDHEKQQNMIQECIQELYPVKYLEYAEKYKERVYNLCWSKRSIKCDKEKSKALMEEVGINSTEIFECVEKNGESLYREDIKRATSFSLRYSPSLVINNFSLGPNFERTPEGIKNIVCKSFNNPPSICSQTLKSSSSSVSGVC